MRHRHPAPIIVIVLLILSLLAACGGRRSTNSTDEDEVQSAIATGIAATQTAERATSEAEVAIAQAVEATVTGLAVEAATAEASTTSEAVEPTPTPESTPAEPTGPNPPQGVEPIEPPAADATPTAPALVVIPFELEPDEAAPTPPALIILPGGGSGDGMEGIIVTEPDLATFDGDSGAPVFRRSISLQMIVRILDEGSADGSGIERVEIEVVDDEGETVYTKIENDAGYCLFGGGEPDCALVRLGNGATWPGTNRPIEGRGYTAFFTVVPEDSSIDYGEWQQDFEVRTPGYAALGEESDVRAELAETEKGSTARTVSDNLVFQVSAADLASGRDDGDGIDYMVMGVIGPDGKQAYAKREDAAAYCAFGGDAPCPAWDFAKNNGRWPDGGQISKGRHILRVIAVTESGRSQVFDWTIDIQ